MNKKRFLIGLLSIGLCIFLNANDAYIEAAGGSIIPIDSPESSAHPSISMKNEVIKIDMQPRSYHVHVDFEFYNEGDSTTIKVGFPQWHYGTTATIDLKNFKTTVNGKTVEYEILEDNGTKTPVHHADIVDLWFVRDITFPSKSTTKTSVDYDCDYGVAGYWKAVEYLFGTGRTWKNPIGSQTIEITNNIGATSVILCDRTAFIESNEWKTADSWKDVKVSNNGEKITITRKNVSPNYFDTFRCEIADDYYLSFPYGDFDSQNYRLGNDRLTEKELVFFTNDQLRYMRNIILAYHGNIFQSADLNNWLKKQDWYKPSHKVELSELSEIELANMNAIQKEEARRK